MKNWTTKDLKNIGKPKILTEHEIQVSCVRWFRLAYPEIGKAFFAVPNGGLRAKKTAVFLKNEGVVSGVSDLILLVSNEKYNGFMIEMKRPKGVHTDTQKAFRDDVIKGGYKYSLCYSLQEFKKLINDYFKEVIF